MNVKTSFKLLPLIILLFVLTGCKSTGPAGPQGQPGIAGPPGAIGVDGETGVTGAMGITGAAGLDGQLRIYGNGSAGSVTINVDTDWSITPPTNLQFHNLTINAGVVLKVPSGMVIRCAALCSNHGTILVAPFASSASETGFPDPNLISIESADSGLSQRAPGSGQFGDNSQDRVGGLGGLGLLSVEAANLFEPGLRAGAGNGVAPAQGSNRFSQRSGGGSLILLARDGVENSGLISAPGSGGFYPGSGGGGGGILILASATIVINEGTLSAAGGAGADGFTDAAGGGGGGGGIIQLLSPVLSTSSGLTNVLGGAGGVAVTVSSAQRSGGGGGGASGGNGGSGGTITTADVATAGSSGLPGYVFSSTVDPTALF